MGEALIVRKGGGGGVSFTYTEATGGTTLEYDFNGRRYRSHTFTSNGDFVVTQVGSEINDLNKVEYLIIAGGGGRGWSGDTWGGGGAGGYRSSVQGELSGGRTASEEKITVTTQTYPVVVGAGGAFSTGQSAKGGTGGTSSVFGITSNGGGGGGSRFSEVGNNGGSGGGAGSNGNNRAGGTGIAGQGTNGGRCDLAVGGGAGGGAGVAATTSVSARNTSNQVTEVASAGGNGLASYIRNGTPEFRAAGAAGSGTATNPPLFTYYPPESGLGMGVNTGSGGGGTGATDANGQAGITIIRYEIAPSV